MFIGRRTLRPARVLPGAMASAHSSMAWPLQVEVVDFRLDRKPIELVIEGHPGMPRLLPHGQRRPGHRRVGKCAKGDADKVRDNFRMPEHCGAAVRAEMKFDLSSRVATAHVDLAPPLGAPPLGADLLFRQIGADAKRRAGTPLALRAMTRTHECRLARRLRAQRTAAAVRDPGHRQTPLFALSRVDRALVSVSVSSSAA